MKLIRMSPAAFIHFGTTRELLHLMTEGMEQFTHLGWQARINTNSQEKSYGAGNSYISLRADVGAGSYIEDSYLHHGTVVGEHCVISGVTLDGQSVPADTVLHGLKLQDGRFVVRMYGVCDNPKEAALFGKRSANRCGRRQFIRFEIRFRKQYLRHCVHMKTVFQH